MLCKKCKTVIQPENGFCPVCKEKVSQKKGVTGALLAVICVIFAGGALYLFFSFTGRLDEPQDEHVNGYEVAAQDAEPQYEVLPYIESVYAEYEYEEEADPKLTMLKEAAQAAEAAMLGEPGGVFVTNRGFLFEAETERFVLHESEEDVHIQILYLKPGDFLDDGGSALRVFAAAAFGERVTIADSEGRHEVMFLDSFAELLAEYDNVHGEITFPEHDGQMAAELMYLAVSFTFNTGGYEVEFLSADDRYAFAIMRDLEEDISRALVFMRERGEFVVAAGLDFETDLRAQVNAALPGFNLALLSPPPYPEDEEDSLP
jgi:hypothetical protein